MTTADAAVRAFQVTFDCGREAEATRLEGLGATRGDLLRADGVDESCQVMSDVEGNEFCLD